MSESPSNAPAYLLSLVEARILGSLLEKETTTPDNYPLSLNSLLNACNQKSNRFPLLELGEAETSKAIETLRSKKLVHVVSQAGSHVAKYKHTLHDVYPISDSKRALLTELLLRGPQTAGELRARCERLNGPKDLEGIRQALAAMMQGAAPLVAELPRQAGKKDTRFAQTLSETPEELLAAASSNEPVRVDVSLALPPEAEARLAALEATVAAQGEQIAQLSAALAAFQAQFE